MLSHSALLHLPGRHDTHATQVTSLTRVPPERQGDSPDVIPPLQAQASEQNSPVELLSLPPDQPLTALSSAGVAPPFLGALSSAVLSDQGDKAGGASSPSLKSWGKVIISA